MENPECKKEFISVLYLLKVLIKMARMVHIHTKFSLPIKKKKRKLDSNWEILGKSCIVKSTAVLPDCAFIQKFYVGIKYLKLKLFLFELWGEEVRKDRKAGKCQINRIKFFFFFCTEEFFSKGKKLFTVPGEMKLTEGFNLGLKVWTQFSLLQVCYSKLLMPRYYS